MIDRESMQMALEATTEDVEPNFTAYLSNDQITNFIQNIALTHPELITV